MAGALFVAGVGEAFQFLACLAPALGGQLNLPGKIGGAGVLIEQATVGIGFQQGLVFVLAVDIDQQFAQGFQVAQWARRAVDIAAGAPLGGDHPAQNAGAFIIKVALGQPCFGFGDVRQVEGGQDVGLVGARAYHATVGAVAKRQAEGVEHDRLAGAGFACDYAHPAIQFKIQMFNDGVVMYRQVHEHDGRSQALGLVIYTVFCSGLTILTLSSICLSRDFF